MGRRVLFGGIWHETNSFSPVPTDLEAFRRFQFVTGEALLTAYLGTNTEIGGFVEAASGAGLTLIPTLFAAAVPSGMVARTALEFLTDAICSRAEQGGFDAVYLALHGAMVAERVPEADAHVVQRVRSAVGARIPVVATFDLHANLSSAIVTAADLLIGYDTLPHVDMAERGREAAALLSRLLASGERPRKAFRKLPLLTVPQMQATHAEPMRTVMAELHAIERDHAVLTASVAPGFAFTDVAHLGMGVLAYGEGAEAAVDLLADRIWERRAEFLPQLIGPEEAITKALQARRGPIILSEPADNVGGGAPGDGTVLLQALLATPDASAVVVLWDPEAAAAAMQLGVGGKFRGSVGGRTLALHGPPVAIEGVVGFAERVTYRRDASYMTGQSVDLGPVGRIDLGGVRVVVTTHRAMPMDTMHLRTAGITPEREWMISVKCASAWEGAFGDMAAGQFYVDTLGICSSNVERMPYTRLSAPLYPLTKAGYLDKMEARR